MLAKTSIVIIGHLTKLLQYYWLYFLCFTLHPLWPIYFITGSPNLLNPFTYFTHSPTPTPLATTSSPHLWIYFFFVHLFCFLDSTHKWMIWYLSLYVWLISLSIIPFRSIHVVTNGKISFFFYVWVYPIVCMYEYMYVCKCVCVCVYKCTHTHTHTHTHTISSLSIHPLMDIWGLSILWLLLIVLLYTLGCMCPLHTYIPWVNT